MQIISTIQCTTTYPTITWTLPERNLILRLNINEDHAYFINTLRMVGHYIFGITQNEQERYLELAFTDLQVVLDSPDNKIYRLMNRYIDLRRNEYGILVTFYIKD